MKDLSNYRKDYNLSSLKEENIPEDPLFLFEKWFKHAKKQKLEDLNAMTLSTIDLNGHPRSRIVLLKGYSSKGFLFFTNYNSIKGKSISKDSRVCLSFFWESLQKQIIVQGVSHKTKRQVSEKYFSSRPRLSKITAVISRQSEKLTSRKHLDDIFEKVKNENKDKEIHCPKHWGGYIVEPFRIEFWQGRKNRMHDRIEYILSEKRKWVISRLFP